MLSLKLKNSPGPAPLPRAPARPHEEPLLQEPEEEKPGLSVPDSTEEQEDEEDTEGDFCSRLPPSLLPPAEPAAGTSPVSRSGGEGEGGGEQHRPPPPDGPSLAWLQAVGGEATGSRAGELRQR